MREGLRNGDATRGVMAAKVGAAAFSSDAGYGRGAYNGKSRAARWPVVVAAVTVSPPQPLPL